MENCSSDNIFQIHALFPSYFHKCLTIQRMFYEGHSEHEWVKALSWQTADLGYVGRLPVAWHKAVVYSGHPGFLHQ